MYTTSRIRKVLTGLLIVGLLAFDMPFGFVRFFSGILRESNVVDALWQAQRSGKVVDSFLPQRAEAAQVTIELDMTDATDEYGPSPSVVFVTDQIGYIFFIDLGNDLVYRKTTNGGSNWNTPVVIDNTLTGWTIVSVWYDQWTPGDTTGTKIHIAAIDDVTGDAYYTFLDTSTDTLKGSMVQVINQTTYTESGGGVPTITKGAGGALFLAANFNTTAGGFVYKSVDGAGNTWTDATPSAWSSVAIDQIQLLPLTTDNDILAIKAQTADNTIRYRIYDEVTDTWDGAWSSSIASLTENTTYDQWFSATLRKKTGDIYLAFSNNTNNVANDIEFWSFPDTTRTWSQKTNVRTNSNQLLSPVPLVEEDSGDIYVAYLEGQTNFTFQGMGVNNITYLYTQRSTDGGATWESRRGVLTDDLGDDYKYLRGNLSSGNRLYAAFYDDDDDDIHGTTIWSSGAVVEANIDTLMVDATDEYGPAPSGVFVDEDVGYQFYVRTNVMLDGTDEFAPSPSTVFTSATTGYIFFIDAVSQDLIYRKTVDGGKTWSGSVIIDTAVTGWTAVSVWYDQWTPGDTTGTKIHIAASDDTSDDIFYTYLDTNGDVLKGSVVTAVSGSTTLNEGADGPPTITKGGAGDLFIAGNFSSTAGGKVSKSNDGAGNTWADVTPSAWSTVAIDQIQLLPLTTDNDILAIRADTTNNDIDYRIYDEVTDAWGGSWTTIAALTENTTYDQWFSATLNKASGDIYLTFTNLIANAAGDIEFWTFSESGRSWTKGTDIVSDLATILAPVPFHEPDTGYIYVAYARGTLANTMHVYYKRSTDGGTTWDAESAALSTTGDDFKALRGNMMHDSVLYIAWHNDDTNVIKADNILSPTTYDLPVNSVQSLVYRKTLNGGAEWGPPYTVALADGTTAVSVWYDQWTPGDTTGTKIHIAFSDDQTDDYYYTYLDTTNDRPAPPVPVVLGTAITELSVGVPGITKGAGGNLFLSGNFNTTAGGLVAKSTDGGVTWTGVTPSAWSSVAIDQIQLLPLTTDNDILAIRADTTNNDIDYRIYDEVTDTWGGSWTTIAALTENTTYDQWFSGSLRKTTGDIYLTFANQTSNAANDIAFWGFDELSRVWSQGADVVTNSATTMMPTPLINNTNGDIYVAYLRGTLAATMDVFLKKSMDNGATWSGESKSLSPGISDDVMALRGNLMSDDRLYVFWYNDDLNDIYGNTVGDQWFATQVAYRWFDNTDSTDVGGALAAQSTPATIVNTGDAFRLRLLLHEIGHLPTLGDAFKLQFAEKSGACDTGFSGESYADVGPSSIIAFHNNTSPADGSVLTANANDPVYGADTIVNQTYEESGTFTNSIGGIPSGQSGKWDFALVDNGAPAETSYCFRVIESDETLLPSYEVIPEITTASGGGGQTLSFALSDNTLGFGTLNASAARYATGDMNGSTTEVAAHTITASTNAPSGYVITIQGDTLTVGGETISGIGAVNSSSAPGTEQFGLRVTAAGGNGAVSTPYAASGFAFDTAAFPDVIASDSDGDDVETVYSLRYVGNISAATAAGEYAATLTYVITAGF